MGHDYPPSLQPGPPISQGASDAGANVLGSEVRVQHMCLYALREQCEGNMKVAWTNVVAATRIAQMIGIHREPVTSASVTTGNFRTEMRRRLFYNYVPGQFVSWRQGRIQ
ncbi:hypothetical protein GGR57DRAFT_477574 [Xylariaceae sp. FL1272]|nr:hypothetical protein GGR57DRAFT_477574 [Xylariaceae sp. FL1272]